MAASTFLSKKDGGVRVHPRLFLKEKYLQPLFFLIFFKFAMLNILPF